MDLDASCAIAEAAFPTVHLSRDVFRAWLGRRDEGTAAAFASDDAIVELWLACAIASGDQAATRGFEDRYIAPLDTTLARMRLGAAELDEVKQLVRAKLLVADASGHPRIEDYAGKGRLSGLVQVIATREALTLLRRARRDAPQGDDDLVGPLVDPVDPGLEALKAKYRSAFRGAFAEAVAALTPKERNLLRMHLLGGVTLEQLASVQGVHRASIVRWLKDARDTVLTKTKSALSRTLGVRADELSSLHALAESRLDASIERLLGTGDDVDGDDGAHDGTHGDGKASQ